MTLREFLEIAKGEQYRIYQPNRDCLIFESYCSIHSPYYFDSSHEPFDVNFDFWKNNSYCNLAFTKSYNDVEVDEETELFLKQYGNMEVFKIETSTFRPTNVYTDEHNFIHITNTEDPIRPGREYLECLNIFIK